jgi:hypothetical protein
MAFELLSRVELQNVFEKTKSARDHITKELTDAVERAVHSLTSPPTVKGRSKEFDS